MFMFYWALGVEEFSLESLLFIKLIKDDDQDREF